MVERAGYFQPLAPELIELTPAVREAITALPGSEYTERHRAELLASVTPLATVMRRAERMALSGALSAAMLAEVWVWVGHLEHVRAYRAATTVQQYARSVSRFLEWAQETGHDYARIKPGEFDAWQKWMSMVLGYSPRWRGRQVSAVRSFYAWRAAMGVGSNQALGLRGPREPVGMPRKYTTAQLRGMLASTLQRKTEAMQMRDSALLLFLLATGARREETSRVTLRDLHLGQRSGLVRLHGKGAKEREVPFEGPVVDALRAWLVVRDGLPFELEQDAVFVGLMGQGRGCRLRVRAIERVVAAHAKGAGLRDWGVHRFRVTFATALYDGGAGIEEIRALMGHENIETTRRYLAVSERTRRTRLSASMQHEVLGTRSTGEPLWMRAVLGRKGT